MKKDKHYSPHRPRRRHLNQRAAIGFRNLTGLLEYTHAFFLYAAESDFVSRHPTLGLAMHGDDAPSGLHEPDLLLRRLYVLEPDDLSDFSLSDLLLAWEHRKHVCGSVEAAAELYALYRVAEGLDDNYQAGERYLQEPEVLAIFDEDEPGQTPIDALPQPSIAGASQPAPTLSLSDTRALSSSDLMRAWEDRPDSFASLEAAAEALAMLRWFSSADPEQKPLSHYLKHPLILEMEDDLPRERPETVQAIPERELALLREDRRETKVQNSVVRTGQRDFRAEVFSLYTGQCCVTGCTISCLLEAAHIIPFRGSQTDHPENGLLLRVDLHRLFDKHLISIEPDTLALIVSGAIDDPGYRSLHGATMFRLTAKPRRLYLEDHYRRYKDAERQRETVPARTKAIPEMER